MSRITLPGPKEILALAKVRADFCVSAYLETPPYKLYADTCRTKLREMIKDAETYLENIGYDKQSVCALAANIEESAGNEELYESRAKGLAFFATPECSRAYCLPNSPSERVEVSDRFFLQPLMRSVFFRRWAGEHIREVHALFNTLAKERRVATDLTDIARAATHGMVSLALIDFETNVTGHIDGGGAFVRSDAPGSYGVIDEIVKRALENGGRVVAVRKEDMVGDTGVAVILRYPLSA